MSTYIYCMEFSVMMIRNNDSSMNCDIVVLLSRDNIKILL